MDIRLTSGMSAEEMQPYWPDIVRCLETYCAKFPEETVENIIAECAQGKRQLWICTENGRVVLTPITEIVTVNASGKKQLLLAEVGGSKLRKCMPLLAEIEAWAKEQGAETSKLIGRSTSKATSGWTAHLLPCGYQPTAVVYEKRL
jgi:hypothetical protein